MEFTSRFFILLSPLILISGGCQSHDAQLSTQDVQNYLDGRPLVVPENVVTDKPVAVLPGDRIVKTVITGQPVTMTTRTIVMKGANISALTAGKAERVNDISWATPVAFLYQDGANMDAVEGVVEHSVSGGKILFLGFQIRKVAKQ